MVMLIFMLLCIGAAPAFASGNVDVTTQHNDNMRTGANLNESALNKSNVNVNQFGKLFSKQVQGQIYVQPLYVSNMNILGKVRNVVFVATMHNTVYCFDADDASADALWSKNLGPSVPLPDNNIGPANYKEILVEVGILSTPVISIEKNAIYLVTMTEPSQGVYEHHLHALDLNDGSEKFSGPKKIEASVPGTGDGAVLDPVSGKSMVPWISKTQSQRLSLTLSNGTVYFGSASFGDRGPYHGWILGYDATTLEQKDVYNTSPSGGLSGVWQSGQGFNVDADGNLFVITGNGTTDPTIEKPTDLGDSVLKLSGSSPTTLLDWFTPFNYNILNINDTDLGSSGGLLIPGTHLFVGGGKEGRLYVWDANNLGHYHKEDDSQIVQSIPNATNGHIHGSPVYWEGSGKKLVYIWSEGDSLKAFQFNGKDLNPTTVSESTFTAPDGMPGGFLSVSANGNQESTGIVWASMPIAGDANQATVDGVLRAFDASDLTKELWNSSMNPVRDSVGKYAKFSSPTIANGKVYLSTFSNQLNVYGLLPQPSAKLKGLSLSGITLDQPFSSQNNSYFATVENTTSATTVTMETYSSNATALIKLNGVATDNPIPLSVGSNVISVEVKDGALQETYMATINRLAVKPIDDPNADLQQLLLSDITLTPTFDSQVTAYTAFVGNEVYSTNVINAIAKGGANTEIKLIVNGTISTVNNPIPLHVGSNIITIVVTSSDSSAHKTYTVTVTRAGNAKLKQLTLSGITLNQTFDSQTTTYTATVENETATTNVTSVLDDSSATAVLKLNGIEMSNPISLSVGSNVITIDVTSNDSSTHQTYKVTITRKDGGGGSGGGGGGVPLPDTAETDQQDSGTTTLNLNFGADVTHNTSSDGQSVTNVAIHPDRLKKAFDSTYDLPSFIVEVTNSTPVVKIDIPAAGLLDAISKKPNGTIVIKSGSASYTLPLTLIKDVQKEDIISVVITSLTGTKKDAINAAIQLMGAQYLLKDPVDFKLSINGIELTDFHHIYTDRTLALQTKVDPTKVTAVWLDNGDNLLFIPSVVKTIGDGTLITIHSPHNSVYTIIQNSKTFNDIQTHWAKQDIELLASKGIVSGESESAFAPEKSITRAEFTALLVRSLGLKVIPSASSFTDVNSTDWYAGAVETSKQAGLISGYDDNSFHPFESITREQIVVMIAHALKIGGNDAIADMGSINKFSDAGDIAKWAQEAVAKALTAKIVQGTGATMFSPKENATRAQSASMLKNLLEILQFIN
jgi:hypothetical protein